VVEYLKTDYVTGSARIKNGYGALEDIFIGDKTIAQFLRDEKKEGEGTAIPVPNPTQD